MNRAIEQLESPATAELSFIETCKRLKALNDALIILGKKAQEDAYREIMLMDGKL